VGHLGNRTCASTTGRPAVRTTWCSTTTGVAAVWLPYARFSLLDDRA